MRGVIVPHIVVDGYDNGILVEYGEIGFVKIIILWRKLGVDALRGNAFNAASLSLRFILIL